MTGTELKIVTPAETEILGPEVDRLPTLHTNARTDRELLEVWLKSHRDGSAHTVRVYARVGERFVAALGDGGLRRATVEGVQAALEAMRVRADGQPVKDATVNTYVGAVKSFLGFAHRWLYPLQRRPLHQAQEGATAGCAADYGRARDPQADRRRQSRA